MSANLRKENLLATLCSASKLTISAIALSIQRHPGYVIWQPTLAEDQFAFQYIFNCCRRRDRHTLSPLQRPYPCKSQSLNNLLFSRVVKTFLYCFVLVKPFPGPGLGNQWLTMALVTAQGFQNHPAFTPGNPTHD